MKIGIIRRGISRYGGAENYMFRLIDEFKRLKHDVVIFCGNNEDNTLLDAKNISKKVIENSNPIEFADKLERSKPYKNCDYLFSLERVWQCDAYRLGDGIHASYLNRLSQKSNILSNFLRKHRNKHKDILKIEQELLSNKSNKQRKFICNSKMVFDELQKYYPQDSKQIKIIYNGYDYIKPNVDNNIRKMMRDNLKIADHDLCLLFSGTGWKRKGLKDCVWALRMLSDNNIKMIVLGVKELSRFSYKNIKFLGKVENPSFYYNLADVFILPTLYDPFSNATLEASSHLLPIITTTSNGCSEILTDNLNSSLLRVDDLPKGLLNAIKFWKCDKKRLSAQESLLQIRKKYTMAKNVESTIKFLFA